MTDKILVCKHCKSTLDPRVHDLITERINLISEGLRQVRTRSSSYEWDSLMRRFDENKKNSEYLASLDRKEIDITKLLKEIASKTQ